MSQNITNNQRPTLNVIDSVTKVPYAVKGNSADGSVNVNITSATVSGSLTNNNTAPGANNIGALTGIANAAAPTYAEGKQVLLSTDLSGQLRVTGSLSVGGTTDNSAYTAGSSTGTPAMGLYHSVIDTVTDGRAATIAITPKRAMMVNLQTAAGVETGIAAAPLQVSLANTGANSSKLLVTADPITFASAQSVNATLSAETTKVIGTVNVAASQTIAVTNTGTFATQSTLGAETTKVIGTVRTADGSGNLFTSNSTTFTAKNAQDINLLGSLGTAFTTAGKIDIKGADGDVFVRQATGTNLHTVVDSGTITAVTAITNALPAGTNVIGHVITDTGSLTAATQSGNWTSRVVGNAGATLDGVIGAATAPTNMLAVGGVFNSSAPSLTNGQSAALQLDTSGNLKVTGSISVGGTTDEATFTAASSTGTPSMGFYNDTTTSNLTAGQIGIPRLSVNRNQYTQIRDGAGNERGANVNQKNQLSVSVDNAPSVSWDSVNGDPVPTTAKGVAVMSVADNLGDPIGSTDGSLNVYVRGGQDATELSQGGVAYFNSSLSTTPQVVKTGRTNVYYLNIVNTNTANAYVQVFDTPVGGVTLGTTPPTEVWFVPAGGCFEEVFPVPLTYWSALQLAATTTATGNTAPTTGLIVNLRSTA